MATKCSKYINRNTREVNPPPTITCDINDTSMSLWQYEHLACLGSSEVRIFPYSQFGQDLSFRNILQPISILHVALVFRCFSPNSYTTCFLRRCYPRATHREINDWSAARGRIGKPHATAFRVRMARSAKYTSAGVLPASAKCGRRWPVIVMVQPGGDDPPRVTTGGQLLQVNGLVLHRAPKPLDEPVVGPANRGHQAVRHIPAHVVAFAAQVLAHAARAVVRKRHVQLVHESLQPQAARVRRLRYLVQRRAAHACQRTVGICMDHPHIPGPSELRQSLARPLLRAAATFAAATQTYKC